MKEFREANRIARSGDYRQAIKEYRRFTGENQQLYSYFENLGWALERQGRIPEAVRSYQKAYRLFPGAARATSALLRYKQYLVHDNRLEATSGDYHGQLESATRQKNQRCETRALSEEEIILIEGSCFDGMKLTQKYIQSGLAMVPDTFALVRIVGNDLPPRHSVGQSLLNLEFILKHEPDLANCTKLWLVNRVFNKEVHDSIIALLRSFNSRFIEIPFEVDKYREAPWDFGLHPQPGFLASESFLGLREDIRMRAEVSTYRYRNLYLMNNNGARNLALEEGRVLAKWVLPWDGNCIVTKQAWDHITRSVVSRPYLKYFVVPMQRLSANSEFLNEDILIQPKEEPQVIMRRDASEVFCAEAPYGRRPKVRFFWRLGIRGVWDNWKDDPWDLERPKSSIETGEYGIAGYTFRLSSASSSLVAVTDSLTGSIGRKTRNGARMSAIIDNIQMVEHSLSLQYPQNHIGYYSTTAIQAAKRLSEESKDSPVGHLVSRVVHKANVIILGGVLQISPKDDTCKPLEEQRRLSTPLCGSRDTLSAGSLSSSISAQIVVLMLAWKLDPDPAYVRKAAGLVKEWIQENNLVAKHRKGENMIRAGALTGLDSLLAAIELINDAEEFDVATKDSLDRHLIALSELIHDEEPRSIECLSVNHVGTYHDLYQSALHAYLGNYSRMFDIFLRLQSRILDQIDEEGKQNNELIGNQTQHYTFKNLLGLMNAFRILAAGGAPRLNVMSEPAQRLRHALDWILRQDLLEWPYLQTQPFDPDLIWPLLGAALDLELISYKELPGSVRSLDAVPFTDSFGDSTGVPIYWNFSLLANLYNLNEDTDRVNGGAQIP